MKRVHIGGVFYGQHNIGDEAILLSMINSFHAEHSLSVSTFDSEWMNEQYSDVPRRAISVKYTKPKMGLYIAPRKKIITNYKKNKEEKKFFSGLDAYICGGATILSDCPWYSVRTVQIAGEAGTRVFLWGVGMAEIESKEALLYIKKILNMPYVELIYTRDELVKERLEKVGISSKKVRVSYDPAIMLTGEKFELSQYLDEQQISLYYNNNKNVVVTVSGEVDVVCKTPIKVIIDSIYCIQKKYKANIFLIPTGCGIQCKDKQFLQEIKQKINLTNVTVIEKEFVPKHLVEFLKKVDLIISSRLHMNIFGVCANTPSIGLVRNKKIVDFATLLGLPYLDLVSLSTEKVMEEVKKILLNKKQIKENISIAVERMRSQYQVSLEEIIMCLNK